MIPSQANDNDMLPKTMCCKCSVKLKSSYDFILQAHDVNTKYSQLLGNSGDPLQDGILTELGSASDWLVESTIDLPLRQYIPEIKLEEDFPEHKVTLGPPQEADDNEAKLEDEGSLVYL